ncbi:V-type ATP synthase subunit I [Halomarina halobia]|uniref:A-type ATP synthase subunit I n=1 Tax=Halomarina halobia TaxID=3033386 RepID=A0ABD6ABD5_9EURY|nr:V-type ATPase 116kDa subunit family protein [Halomarina sp. PSR21]
MLRPERMSRVSVTGSKKVIDDAIEAVHDLNLLHITDYGGEWEAFTPGNPLSGADRAAERLVTVRALQSILGIEDEDAGPARIVTEEALEEDLEEIRRRVNELDDRRDDLRDDLRAVEDRTDAMEPFARLNIDLDLLSGYDSLSVAAGEGDAERVRNALDDAGIDDYRVFAEDGVLAVFARTDELDDVLVGTEFAAYDIPDAAGTPSEYVSELEHERKQLQSKLRTVENQLEEERYEVGGFLLAAEETLAIEVEQREAPLSFATTENAFVAEGWIPTDRVGDLEDGLKREVGEHVDVDELEVAQYDGHGRVVEREDVGGAPGSRPTAAADGGDGADGDEEVAADGGTVDAERGPHGETTLAPPVVQQNPGPVKPFETIVQVINRPRYSELDPTVVLFLTFPLFFGLMIGDLGYGLLYIAIGWYIYTKFESEAIKSLGGVGIIAGVATVVFGILYGEVFGLHVLGDVLWGGSPPIHKGLQPHYEEYAFLWLVISVLLGLLHLTIGYAFDFYEHLDHGFKDAMLHSGSWILMLVGLWAFVFSDILLDTAPAFMVGPQSVFNGNPLALGFTGFPEPVGYLGLAVFAVGLVLLVYGEPIEGVEALNVLVNGLSYTRLAAVLLAKAGMAFVVNLLAFGAYEHDGEWHFIFPHSLAYAEEHGEVVFGGLMTGTGPLELVVGGLVGVLILVVGHALVLVLGVTSAGLQAVRLEYVEFFGKFFEGGGEAYEPFGYERTYTTED